MSSGIGSSSEGDPLYTSAYTTVRLPARPLSRQIDLELLGDLSSQELVSVVGLNAQTAAQIRARLDNPGARSPATSTTTPRVVVDPCAHCGASGAPKACAGCGRAKYCNQACQRSHWQHGGHKEACAPAAAPAVVAPGAFSAAAPRAAQAVANAAPRNGSRAKGNKLEEPPPDLCCPITRELFQDPVFAADGETVSNASGQQNFKSSPCFYHSSTCPSFILHRAGV